jgi:hypothetical protein
MFRFYVKKDFILLCSLIIKYGEDNPENKIKDL